MCTNKNLYALSIYNKAQGASKWQWIIYRVGNSHFKVAQQKGAA